MIVFVKEGGTRFVLAFLCLERGKEREEKSRERERVLAKLVVLTIYFKLYFFFVRGKKNNKKSVEKLFANGHFWCRQLLCFSIEASAFSVSSLVREQLIRVVVMDGNSHSSAFCSRALISMLIVS